MNGAKVIERIEAGRVIAILRGDFRKNVSQIAGALVTAGVTAVEATLNSPAAIELITILAGEFGHLMAVGAGTVLKADEVSRVAGAGAQFIVSPNCAPAVIAQTKRLNLISIPGCFTPTEVIAAIDAGADAVKLFPAGPLGPGYVKALRGPLADVRLIPTGGVTPQIAREYRRAGAWAVGVGSELIGPDFQGIESRARAFVTAMRGDS